MATDGSRAVAVGADPDERRRARVEALPDTLRERILVLDGAMGTMLQGYGLAEADFRGAALRATTRATCAAPTTCSR